MNTNTNNIMEMMGKPVYTPLKEGTYKGRIEGIGINVDPTEVGLGEGYYKKAMPEGKNNNYFRIDLVTAEGKKINRNVFPENVNVVISNIKRQLNIEEDKTPFEVLTLCMDTETYLDFWVWYNDSNKNVDFYDAIAARENQNSANTAVLNALLAE